MKLSMGLLVVGILFLGGCSLSGQYDGFAQCLTERGVSMYGAYWCPHCAEQKAMFGKSWDHVNYIECSLPNRGGQTAICNTEGITAYPTWEYSDGTRHEGQLTLLQLSQLSGCNLATGN